MTKSIDTLIDDREKQIRRIWSYYNSDYIKRTWLYGFLDSEGFKQTKRVILPFPLEVTSYSGGVPTPIIQDSATYEYQRFHMGNHILFRWVSEGIILEEWNKPA